MAGMTHGHSNLRAHHTEFTAKEATIPGTGQPAVTAYAGVTHSSPTDSTGLPDTAAGLQVGPLLNGSRSESDTYYY